MNEAAMLSELHRVGPMRRGELSERLGLRKSSVSNITAEFVERGVLLEDPPGAMRSVLRLHGEAWRTLVAHVEAGRIRVATVRYDGEIDDEQCQAISDRARPDAILKELADMLAPRLNGGKKSGLTGIGVAIPGITDALAGRGVHAVNLAGWANVEVASELERVLRHPVAVANDVRCQLLGNAWFGPEAGGCQDVYYVSIQKGVASAAMVGGEVLRGRRFAAGEIGCLRAGGEGRDCRCGKKDCLQTYVSAPALLGAVNEGRGSAAAASLHELVEIAGSEPSAAKVLEGALEPLVAVLGAAVSVLDPEVVLLATDDSGFSDLLRPLIERRLNTELLGQYARNVSVLVAESAEDSTLRGMASILIQRAFSSGMDVL